MKDDTRLLWVGGEATDAEEAGAEDRGGMGPPRKEWPPPGPETRIERSMEEGAPEGATDGAW